MPSDYYLKMDGINGESQAEGMKDNIELDSWSFGVGAPADLGGKGLSGGKPSLSDFTVGFALDSASYQILKDIYNGKPVATTTFSGRKTGGGGTPYVYLKITLTNCFVTGFSTGGGASGTPSASMTLAFEKIEYEYFTQDTATGGVTSAGTATYDIKQVKQT